MSQLIKINRRDPFSLLRREVDSLLDGMTQWGSEGHLMSGTWFPIDLAEAADGYEVSAEIAGVERESIEISVDRNVLTIRVVKAPPVPEEGRSVHLRERVYGEFSRSVSLPRDVDTGDVKASYSDGLLTIRVPKAESSKPKRIAIE
jgi:HSP20 family protein